MSIIDQSMSAVERASEKYLGQNHLKDLNTIAPSINADKLVLLVNSANELLEHCVGKYSFDVLSAKTGFQKQFSTVIQVLEIDKDQKKINELSHKIQKEIEQCTADLEKMNACLTPLSEIYADEKYLTTIIPDQDEHARIAPRIVGVIQVATLKRETIMNAITQAKKVEFELINFADTTMFQIREGLSRIGDTSEMLLNVQETIHKRLEVSEKTLNIASMISVGSMGGVAGAVIFGLVGFPLPINQIGAGASFVFVLFILSLSLCATVIHMIRNSSKGQMVFGKQFNGMVKKVSYFALFLFALSSGLLYLDRDSFAFYQLFPIASMILLSAGAFFGISSVLAKKHTKKVYDQMLEYKHRISEKNS